MVGVAFHPVISETVSKAVNSEGSPTKTMSESEGYSQQGMKSPEAGQPQKVSDAVSTSCPLSTQESSMMYECNPAPLKKTQRTSVYSQEQESYAKGPPSGSSPTAKN